MANCITKQIKENNETEQYEQKRYKKLASKQGQILKMYFKN